MKKREILREKKSKKKKKNSRLRKRGNLESRARELLDEEA